METEKISYLIGRLVGLNELVSLLKDIATKSEKGDNTEITKTMIIRISNEMTQIINELKVEKGIREGKVQVEEEDEEEDEKPAEKPAKKKSEIKSTSNADELMQELTSFKGK